MKTPLFMANLYILVYPKTSKDFQTMLRLYKHLTMFQFLIPHQEMIQILAELFQGKHMFIRLFIVHSHVLIVVNHQYKDVPLDSD